MEAGSAFLAVLRIAEATERSMRSEVGVSASDIENPADVIHQVIPSFIAVKESSRTRTVA
jgi:hypothetical protein